MPALPGTSAAPTITGLAVPEYVGAGGTPALRATAAQLNELTKKILEKEIELERLNTRFRIETTLISPWQQRRVFVYGETNASCSEAGIITALPVRYRLAHFKNGKVSAELKSKLRGAADVQLVGQMFNAAGDIFELGLNFKHYLGLRERGFNPQAYRNRIRDLHAEVDTLMEQRSHGLKKAQLSPEDLKVAQAEGQLLHSLRDLSLLEYARSHAAARSLWAYQNTAFLVDFAKNTTGASANIITLAADHLHHPHWGGATGLMQTVSGFLTLVTPVVGRVTGNMSGLAARRVSSTELTNVSVRSVDVYAKERLRFLSVTSATAGSSPYLLAARQRASFYEQEENILRSMHSLLQKQRKDAHGALVENVVFASVVAPPRITNGILGMIAGWHYYNRTDRANKLYAAGNTAYLVGNSFNMFETARVLESAELSEHRLKKAGMLPRQQFNTRLQTLDAMEKGLKK
jgi:hypothetical protein